MAQPAVAPSCKHCGLAIPAGAGGDFCCGGCEAVHRLLHAEGLSRYYELKRGVTAPAAPADARADRKWVEATAVTPACPLRLDLQGLRCAACVWLVEELSRRHGADAALVNPGRGTLELSPGPDFRLAAFVEDVERFGYRLGPAARREHTDPVRSSSKLLLRLGVATALAMNAMIFAVAVYAGLDGGPLYRLFMWLQLGLATASVLVGGPVFFRSAAAALRRGILHMDLPIALGILLAYAGSLAAFAGDSGAVYFDTLSIFIALMLAGRFLQERVLERNRRQILESTGADSLFARRLAASGEVELVRCAEVRAGDRLMIAAGDLLCVDARIEADAAFSLDWIDGESVPRGFAAQSVVPAGAFNAGEGALLAVAEHDFADSALLALLESPTTRGADAARQTPFWRRVARAWVAAVLVVSAAVFAAWLAGTGDVRRAIEVTAAVLIVTCPCAFGIATPLGYELVQAGLRRAGLFVRTAGFLDRAVSVRRVVFDKTGTLTTGDLALADLAPLAALDAGERERLYDLAARSTHPKSQAVARALAGAGRVGLHLVRQVVEIPGRGVQLAEDGHVYRLGTPAWAAAATELPPAADLVFARDGEPLAVLATVENLRPDAADELTRLRAGGLDVWILSGDDRARVAAMAARLGLPADRARGGMRPEDKAAWLAAHDHGDTLMIGDGLNDGPAVERATCSGTPAIDRPFVPARSDFYFTTPGLRPVRLALAAARALAGTVRRNLALATAYNLAAVSLAAAGLMTPLLCAVVMPLSSLSVVALTTWSLSRRSPLWKS